MKLTISVLVFVSTGDMYGCPVKLNKLLCDFERELQVFVLMVWQCLSLCNVFRMWIHFANVLQKIAKSLYCGTYTDLCSIGLYSRSGHSDGFEVDNTPN